MEKCQGRAGSGKSKRGRERGPMQFSTPGQPPTRSESAFSNGTRNWVSAEGVGVNATWKGHVGSFDVRIHIISGYGSVARRQWVERLAFSDGLSSSEADPFDDSHGDPDGEYGAGVRQPLPKSPGPLFGEATADVEAHSDLVLV